MEDTGVSKLCSLERSIARIVTVYWTLTVCPAGARWWSWWPDPVLTGLICWEEPDNSQQPEKKMCNLISSRLAFWRNQLVEG